MGGELRPLTPVEFAGATGAGPDVVERLRAYEALLRKWQAAINLVGPNTLRNLWRRHFLDSAQLFPLAPIGAKVWVDVGSGAGFPGLILAAMGAPRVHLIESDVRKGAFLNEAARVLGLGGVTVHPKRVQDVSRETLGGSVDVLTARAWTRPDEVLRQTGHLVDSETTYLLPVGQSAQMGLTALGKERRMTSEVLPSRTDPASAILRIQGVSRGTATDTSGP